MRKVSICIPVYNRLELAMQCVAAIQATVPGGLAEIIVGDDASPSVDVRDWIKGRDIECFRNETNLGFGANCNAIAERATGDYLIFVNTDTIAQPGWIEPMLKVFDEHERVGIVGPKLVFPDGKIQSCGGWYDEGKGPYHRYIGARGDAPWANVTEEVSWITGAAMMVSRSLFEGLNGFDAEAFPRGYFEDVDLCERAKDVSGSIWYSAESTFVHLVGQSTSSSITTYHDALVAADRFRRNSIAFHKRHNEKIIPDAYRRLDAPRGVMVPY